MSRVPKEAKLGRGGIDGAVAAAALPFIPPWAGWFFLPLVPFLLRRWAHGDVTAMTAAGACVTLAAVGLAAFAGHLFRARGMSVRIHAVVTMAAAGGWCLVGLILGAQRPSLPLWAVGFLVPLTWSMRRLAQAKRGDEDGGDGWGDLAKRAKLPGSRVQAIRQNGEQLKARIRVAPGEQTGADVAAAVPNIASALGAPPAGVRAVPSRDRADEAELTVVMRDVLAQPTLWPGLSAPGASIAEPLRIGVYDNGAPVLIWLTGDKKLLRVSTHILWAGLTGTGKSHGSRLMLVEALSRPDCEVHWLDIAKPHQTLGPLAGLADQLITERKAAQAAIKALPALIRARTDFLAARGYDEWVPGCGLPYLLFHIEEAPDLIGSSTAIVRPAGLARSAGITLSLSMQRTTHTSMPVDVRQQMGTVACFGLKDGDAQYALSDFTLDAGANPEAWGQSRPGALYLETPGAPQEQWATPARTYAADTGDLAAALAGRQPVKWTPAGGTGAVEPARGDDGQGDEAAPADLDALADELVGDLDDVEELDDDAPDGVSGLPVPESPEPDLDVDPEQDIAEDDDEVLQLALPEPVEKVGREEALRKLRAFLAHLAEQGFEQVYVNQLVDFRHSIGRSRPWLSGELAAMVERGELEPSPERGAYRLRARVGAAAAG